MKEIENKCKKIVDEATDKAMADPFPKAEEDLYTDVYGHPELHFLRGVEYEKSKF